MRAEPMNEGGLGSKLQSVRMFPCFVDANETQTSKNITKLLHQQNQEHRLQQVCNNGIEESKGEVTMLRLLLPKLEPTTEGGPTPLPPAAPPPSQATQEARNDTTPPALNDSSASSALSGSAISHGTNKSEAKVEMTGRDQDQEGKEQQQQRIMSDDNALMTRRCSKRARCPTEAALRQVSARKQKPNKDPKPEKRETRLQVGGTPKKGKASSGAVKREGDEPSSSASGDAVVVTLTLNPKP